MCDDDFTLFVLDLVRCAGVVTPYVTGIRLRVAEPVRLRPSGRGGVVALRGGVRHGLDGAVRCGGAAPGVGQDMAQ